MRKIRRGHDQGGQEQERLSDYCVMIGIQGTRRGEGGGGGRESKKKMFEEKVSRCL